MVVDVGVYAGVEVSFSQRLRCCEVLHFSSSCVHLKFLSSNFKVNKVFECAFPTHSSELVIIGVFEFLVQF